ncbi:hypothetical protein SAMN05518865_111208 [Duganella sp. CF458]|uniref:hypothetical protein n=1 Tax=Duganella sp. CF458 TaxID=1884368 RepID=UPI0008E42082|nr:hypothetical protein [Duganella sp. CF458]SFG39396.1 hypothetical protein SAMN05518865_111208 [Duganella sp. CF458]
MAQGPMDFDRVGSVPHALDEHKELTREQFHEILRRLDAQQAEARDMRERALARSDALHAEHRRRHDELAARMDRKFDRQTALILTSWLSTMATLLYLHLR